MRRFAPPRKQNCGGAGASAGGVESAKVKGTRTLLLAKQKANVLTRMLLS